MPKLIRMYITNVAIGFALALVFVVGLVWFNIANLGHLVLETDMGWLAFLMLTVSNGVVFAGAQFAIAVMQMAERDEGPRGGLRAPALIPIRVEARAETNRARAMMRRR